MDKRLQKTTTVQAIDDGEIMRAADVARFMKCAQSTVWKWVERGILPKPTRMGSRFSFWRKSQIERALSEAKAGEE